MTVITTQTHSKKVPYSIPPAGLGHSVWSLEIKDFWTHPNSWLSLLQGYLFSNLPLPIEEPVSAILSFQGQILSSITPFKTSELRCAHNFSLTFANITKPSLLDTVIRDRAPTRWLLPIRHCHLLWGYLSRLQYSTGLCQFWGVTIIEDRSPLISLSSQATLPKLLSVASLHFRNLHSSYCYPTQSKLTRQAPLLNRLL